MADFNSGDLSSLFPFGRGWNRDRLIEDIRAALNRNNNDTARRLLVQLVSEYRDDPEILYPLRHNIDRLCQDAGRTNLDSTLRTIETLLVQATGNRTVYLAVLEKGAALIQAAGKGSHFHLALDVFQTAAKSLGSLAPHEQKKVLIALRTAAADLFQDLHKNNNLSEAARLAGEWYALTGKFPGAGNVPLLDQAKKEEIQRKTTDLMKSAQALDMQFLSVGQKAAPVDNEHIDPALAHELLDNALETKNPHTALWLGQTVIEAPVLKTDTALRKKADALFEKIAAEAKARHDKAWQVVALRNRILCCDDKNQHASFLDEIERLAQDPQNNAAPQAPVTAVQRIEPEEVVLLRTLNNASKALESAFSRRYSKDNNVPGDSVADFAAQTIIEFSSDPAQKKKAAERISGKKDGPGPSPL